MVDWQLTIDANDPARLVRNRSTDLEGNEGVDHYGVTMLDPEGNEFCVA